MQHVEDLYLVRYLINQQIVAMRDDFSRAPDSTCPVEVRMFRNCGRGGVDGLIQFDGGLQVAVGDLADDLLQVSPCFGPPFNPHRARGAWTR
jgi:hypothetical protein